MRESHVITYIKKYLRKIDKQLFIHIVSFLSLSIFLSLFFVYIFLPIYTRQGSSITVPNLKGIEFEEATNILKSNKLRYTIKDDKTYSEEYPPNYVLSQEPLGGFQVKKDRTIYLSINSSTPPKVKMPNLLMGSFRNAYMILKNHGLKIGIIRYKANIAKNAVLKQLFEGEEIEPGEKIPKGSTIDLIIGAGLGKKKLKM